MNAPKEITVSNRKNRDSNNTLIGATYETSVVPLAEFYSTKYIRADLVEALVKACNEHQEFLSHLWLVNEGRKQDQDQIAKARTALSTALKALGE